MTDTAHETFGEVRARLDEIVDEVRDKNLSLEKSLDLYEEAIKLGNRCAELVDKPDFTEAEAAMARETLQSEAQSSDEQKDEEPAQEQQQDA